MTALQAARDLGLVIRRLAVALVVGLGFLLEPTAQSASFACDLAKSTAEKAICSNPELSTLDEHLGRYYSAARSVLKSADSCLVSDQRNWLRAQRDSCSDAACLRQAYLRRLAELDPLQPGVTRIRNIQLPSVKSLVWIVPPASDRVAAPLNKEARLLVARGAILDEVSGGGDGYVLSADDGRRLLIVPLMFLESPATEILASLAQAGGEYEVRGYSEISDDNGLHFAPSRCVFVYRTAH